MGNIIGTEAAPLFDAIAEGDVDAAVKALEAHPGLSHKRVGSKSRTIYHACAKNGQVAVLKRLCDHIWRTVPNELGKVHDKPPQEGRSHPVIYQAVNSYDQAGHTPLMLACKKGHAKVVEYMLSQGADPWIGDRLMGRCALHHAARADHADCIEVIMSSPFVEKAGRVRNKECKLVDYPSNSGYAPLHYAATSRSAESAAALFRHGANPNGKTWDVGFDFIQLDRGSTALHAAARFQNLDMAMMLLKYWDENLRRQEVTDPRVVENYNRVKPYQFQGLQVNKALFRVLDPATPIREITDPFDETSKGIVVRQAKTAPLTQQRSSRVQAQPGQDSDLSKPNSSGSGGWGSTDKVPPGWEDLLPSKSGANGNGRGSAPDFVCVYQCAELIADNGAGPSSREAELEGASPGGSLAHAGSLGARGGLPPATLGRTRSGAVVFPMPSGAAPPQQLQRAGSLQPTSALPRMLPPLDQQVIPEKGTPGSPCLSPTAASGGWAVTKTAASPFASIQPVTPPKADSVGAGAGGLRTAGSLSERDGGLAAGYTPSVGGTSFRRAANAMLPPKPPSPDNEAAGGRLLARASSKKASTGFGGPSGPDSSNAHGAAGGAAAALARAPSSRGSSPPSTALGGAAPPPAISAWGDSCVASVTTTASRKGKLQPQVEEAPDFTRDSHAETSQPVEVTMYPHTRLNLQPLRNGETSNTLEDEMVAQSYKVLQTRSHVGSDAGSKASATSNGRGSTDAATAAGGFSATRRGLMPTNDLSDDESRAERRGGGPAPLAAQGSLRRAQ